MRAKPHTVAVQSNTRVSEESSRLPVRRARPCRHPGVFFSFSDHGHRIRQTLRPQEGHERNLQREIPPHKAHAQQDQEVKMEKEKKKTSSEVEMI